MMRNSAEFRGAIARALEQTVAGERSLIDPKMRRVWSLMAEAGPCYMAADDFRAMTAAHHGEMRNPLEDGRFLARYWLALFRGKPPLSQIYETELVLQALETADDYVCVLDAVGYSGPSLLSAQLFDPILPVLRAEKRVELFRQGLSASDPVGLRAQDSYWTFVVMPEEGDPPMDAPTLFLGG